MSTLTQLGMKTFWEYKFVKKLTKKMISSDFVNLIPDILHDRWRSPRECWRRSGETEPHVDNQGCSDLEKKIATVEAAKSDHFGTDQLAEW